MLKLADLDGIADGRRGQGRMYELPHVVLCCTLAVAVGADSYRAIVRFIDVRLEWLREYTGLGWRRAPSHTGLRLIPIGLDHEAIEQALHRRARAALDDGGASPQGLIVALDGKTLRGSPGRFADRAPPQWLSAFAPGQRLVLGQIAWHSGDKDDEIAAARRLIAELGLQGKLFTLDALHVKKDFEGRRRQRQRPARASQGQPAEPARQARCPARAEPARRDRG